jgi:diadenosine tetraphosphatase ApaH/serine/threonine PP2A family protein phosphatase
MRALVISDIHSNLPALESVLAAAPHYDVVWNLGDIVGYGANPNQVVHLARNLNGIVVRGNHDRACSGNMGAYEFLDLSFIARYAADWTKETLTKENADWLSRLPRGPLSPLGGKVACAHGSPRDEDEYVLSNLAVSAAFRATRARIILCGHTHGQFGWVSNRRKLTFTKPSFQSSAGSVQFELQLRTENRYLLNPGSVGQPRDRDWRAAFAVYDDDRSLLTWYRVPYKVLTAQRRIRRAQLPEVLATRLRDGT